MEQIDGAMVSPVLPAPPLPPDLLLSVALDGKPDLRSLCRAGGQVYRLELVSLSECGRLAQVSLIYEGEETQ